uniref:Uncharacterized protein n=1 Tax=Arundo donax TaxID=35708 RepID=A0A0A9FD95_ARUDO
MLPPAEALLPRGRHGGGALEPRGGAGDGDAAGVLESELLLRLLEQLPEHGVVEVRHRHHVPHRLRRRGAAHVHRHLPLGRGHRLSAVEHPVPAGPPPEVQPPRQRPAPPQNRRELLGRTLPAVATGGSLQAEVASPAPSPAAAERPPPEAEQLPADPEPSVGLPYHSEI